MAAYMPGILFSPDSKQAALPFPRRKKKNKAKNLLGRRGGGGDGREGSRKREESDTCGLTELWAVEKIS